MRRGEDAVATQGVQPLRHGRSPLLFEIIGLLALAGHRGQRDIFDRLAKTPVIPRVSAIRVAPSATRGHSGLSENVPPNRLLLEATFRSGTCGTFFCRENCDTSLFEITSLLAPAGHPGHPGHFRKCPAAKGGDRHRDKRCLSLKERPVMSRCPTAPPPGHPAKPKVVFPSRRSIAGRAPSSPIQERMNR